MNDKTQTEVDESQISETMADIAERSQRLLQDFISRQGSGDGGKLGFNDPFNLGNAFFEMTTRMMSEPHKIVEANMNLWQDYMRLWQSTAQRMMGQDAEPVVEPARDDRRFKNEA